MCKGTPAARSDIQDAAGCDGPARSEEGIAQEVRILLEAMNRASSEINALERRTTEAQERYKRRLAQWGRIYEDLRAQHGTSFDRVKPYYYAAQEVKATSGRMQRVAQSFSEAASQHARAAEEAQDVEAAAGTPRVSEEEISRLREARDSWEREYAEALTQYRVAQEAVEAMRVRLGDDEIRRALPCMHLLQKHQLALAYEHNRINLLSERALLSKGVYRHSMRELERLSSAVHETRRQPAQAPVTVAA